MTHTWLRAGFRANHAAMQIGMRQVSAETVEWFGTACKGGGLTRTAPARGLCERESWSNDAGRPVLASARRILPRLAETLGEGLPAIFPGRAEQAAATTVDASFTGIVNMDLMAARPVPDVMFPGVPVSADGLWKRGSKDTQRHITAGFAGPGHAQAGGMFHTPDMTGTFGARRQWRRAFPAPQGSRLRAAPSFQAGGIHVSSQGRIRPFSAVSGSREGCVSDVGWSRRGV